jgi:hypothetical protein
LRNEQFGSKTFDVEPEPILRPWATTPAL